MSNFIVIVPDGWTALDYDRIQNVLNVNISSLKDWINASYFLDVEPTLKEDGMVPMDKTIVEMKIIDDSQLWVRLG
jgi:hypothetical protein